MMRRLFGARRWMLLLPLPMAFLLSDHTLFSFWQMLVGGVIFWIPFWLAWWLSDGFSGFTEPASFDDDVSGYGYRLGNQGYGYYNGLHRMR